MLQLLAQSFLFHVMIVVRMNCYIKETFLIDAFLC